MARWYVYLLRCADDSLYCGTTTDLERRLDEHNRGTGSRYTRSRLPVRLVWSSALMNKSEAYKEEYRIKRLGKTTKEIMASQQPGQLERTARGTPDIVAR